jgi:hypothetical protein
MPHSRTIVLLLIVFATSYVRAQPSVSYTVPAAVQPGKTIELTLHGAKLDDPLRIWTSFPAQVEVIPAEAGKKDLKSRTCKITVDGSAAVGTGGIVVGNAAGTSDVLYINLDDLASVADDGKNGSLASAQVLTLPIAVDGVSNGAVFDHYKFSAKKGQRVAIEVVASRIGSTYDAVLRLLDSAGKEIQFADDDPSLGADCRIAHVFDADGDYVLELHDNQYRGGGRYRLRVGDFPLVTSLFPMGGRFGSTAKFDFIGPSAEGTLPVFVRIPGGVRTSRLAVNARFPDGKSSAAATLVASRLPEDREVEPNNDIKIATLITLPCAVNGILGDEADRDYFQFAAVKGQAISFTAVSRSLGSPALLFMRLLKEDGSKLAETAVDTSEEFALTHSFAADGIYHLLVYDLLRRGGPEYVYRVEMASNVGFSLSLKNDKATAIKFITTLKTGAFALDVQCARRSFDGPITLSLEDSATGFQLINNVIPKGAKTHRVLVTVPADAQAADLHALRMVGTADHEGRQLSSVVSTTALIRARKPVLSYPPSWIDGLLMVATAPEAAAFFETKLSGDKVAFARDKGLAELTVTLERKNKDFKAAITVVVEGLAAPFSYAVKQDKDSYKITIKGPKDAAAQSHALRIIGYGALKGKGQVVIKEAALEVAAAAGE